MNDATHLVRPNNLPPYDLTGRYNTPTSRIIGTRTGQRSKYGPRGSDFDTMATVTPAPLYSPRKKAPSARDKHRMEVAERKAQ